MPFHTEYGMAVAIDEGHPTDVHPRRKKVIGQRLARLALVKPMGCLSLQKAPVLVFRNGFKEGCQIRLSFQMLMRG